MYRYHRTQFLCGMVRNKIKLTEQIVQDLIFVTGIINVIEAFDTNYKYKPLCKLSKDENKVNMINAVIKGYL